jgi:transcriptional regulator with XRE-family HTH domain
LARQSNEGQKFGTWLKSQRHRLGHNEVKFARRLGLSPGTVILWEAGGTPWAVIPQEYKRMIEDICGPFPSREKTGLLPIQETRQPAGTGYSTEITRGMEKGYPDAWCKCGTPILPGNDRCPECNKPFDWSQ